MEIATVFGKGPKTEVTASLTIKDFIDVMESSEPGKSYETDDFMVKETPLRLVVYPKGRAEEYRGGVSVYCYGVIILCRHSRVVSPNLCLLQMINH